MVPSTTPSLFDFEFSEPRLWSWRMPFIQIKWWWFWRQRQPRYKEVLAPVSSAAHEPAASPVFFRKRWVGAVAIWSILFILVTGTASAAYLYQVVFTDLPSPQRIRVEQPDASTKIYDRHGNLLYKIFKDENRTMVPLAEVSPYLVQATLAIEDTQFYEHWGISFRGIGRAFMHNIQQETTQGGSTITQQLVKNTLLSPERTWQRKVREIVLAFAVEQQYSKQEILERYLNEVNYGGSIYGVEEASQWFFGKPAAELTLAESALLAGLPVAPTAYSPYGTHPELAFQRQQEVLNSMVEIGFITPEQKTEAAQQEIAFRQATYDIKSPHFVMYMSELLVNMFGEEMVRQGGLEVYTTLDSSVQASAEAALAAELTRLERLKVGNGAVLVTDPRSGAVLAMVGSRNYFDRENDGEVNVVLRPRQPGSSIKPLTYALAFEKGFTPATTIEDSPVVYTAEGAPPYAPKNYDGRFHGNVTLREALGSSYNIPAVRLLVEVGVDALVQQGKAMGITTWDDPSRFGLALTLGGGEVTMYDMARVYGTFANGGENVALNPLVEVKNGRGSVMYRNPCADAIRPCKGKRVLSEGTAYNITDVLRDNTARTPAFGSHSVLNIPEQEVAVKTGTTNSLRDNWTIGYTSEYVVLTWVGNNDNTPMSAVASGVTGASPIWSNVMKGLLAGQNHQFALPTGLVKVAICARTRTLPCSACPKVVEEIFPVGREPKAQCTDSMFSQLSEKPEREKTVQR